MTIGQRRGFGDGLPTVLRRASVAARPASLRLALPLYLSNLLPGLIPTWAVAVGFAQVAGDRPWGAALLGGDWLNQAAELAAGAVADAELGGVPSGRLAAAAAATSLAIFLGLVGLALQGLAYNFMAGGILERLRTDMRSAVEVDRGAPPPLSFWAASRRWFWPFVRLGILGTTAFGLLVLVGVLVLSSLGSLFGPSVVLVTLGVWVACLNGWLELARAGMVARGDPGARRALGRAARLVLDPAHLPRVLAVWAILGLLGAAVLLGQALGPTTFDPAGSTVALVLAAVVGQLLQLIGAWLKVARLAAALALDQELAPTEAVSAPKPQTIR